MRRRTRTLLPAFAALLGVAWTASALRDLLMTPGAWEVEGLERVSDALDAEDVPVPDDAPRLHAVTWNLHSGLGAGTAWRRARADVEADLRAIAAAIADAAPADAPVDVVGLNEVDFGSSRSGGFDQAAFVADELLRLTGARYEVVRLETWRRDLPGLRVRFGTALLSRHPVLDVASCLLEDGHACDAVSEPPPGLPPLRAGGWLAGLLSEPRGVVRATLRLPAGDVDVLVTHLEPFLMAEREAQAVHLQRRWVRPDRPTLLMGDMNSVPPAPGRAGALDELRGLGRAADRTWAALTSGSLRDALRRVDPARVFATYPARAPERPIDWVLSSPTLVPEEARVLECTASDHLGVAVRLAFVAGDRSAVP